MIRITNLFKFACIYLLFLPLTALGQSTCDEKQYRQFDFWLGNWQVTLPDGKLAGNNVISVSLNGCIIREHYTTPTGYEGYSFNIFDKQTGQWHQTWVDNSGLLLKLDGNLQGDQMVLSGEGKAPDGSELIHKITWTPNEDGTVTQFWQTSNDKGTTWTQAFLGKYSKIKQ